VNWLSCAWPVVGLGGNLIGRKRSGAKGTSSMSRSDQAVLKRWITGRDAEAFRAIVERHAGKVYATCRRILRNDSEAEEVTQECFETLVRTTDREQPHNLGPWLHGMATYKCLKHLRSEGRRRQREAEYAATQRTSAEYQWNDIYSYVDEAIAALPQEIRSPVVTHFLYGQSHSTIARASGVPRRTISNRINKGVGLIGESLRKRGIALPIVSLAAMLGSRLAEAVMVPTHLLNSLGRLALSHSAHATGGISVFGTATAGVLGGILTAKKAIVGLAVIVGAVGGLWIAQRYLTETPENDFPRNNPRESQPRTERSPIQPARETPLASKATAMAPVTEMSLKPASISGKVYDKETGQQITGAEMAVWSRKKRYSTLSDEDGHFQVDSLPPDTYHVFCRHANGYYINLEKEDEQEEFLRLVVLDAGQHRDGVDFGLSRGHIYRGRVVDTAGRPVAAAHVTGRTEINQYRITQRAESQGDGSFLVSGFPPTVRLFLWAERDELVSEIHGPFGVPQSEGQPVELVLHPEAIIRGVVVDEQEQPLPGLRVVPQFKLSEANREKESVSDEEGRFELTGMFPGNPLLRVCRDVGIVNSPCPSVSLSAGQVVEDMVLVCQVGELTIAGEVVDSRGNPLPGARVACIDLETNREARTRADGQGTFTVEGLRYGHYRVEAEHTRYLRAEQTEVTAGSHDVRLVLPDPLLVEGRVMDATTNRPVQEYELKYCYSPTFMLLEQRYEKMAGRDGAFSLKVARLGKVRIAARAEGYLLGYTDVDLEATDRGLRDVEILLQPQQDLHGIVYDQDGGPIASALIFSGPVHEYNADDYASARSGADGNFVLPAHKLGHDFISAFHPDHPKTMVALEPEHYAGEPIEIVVSTGATLVCTLLRDGVPCAKAFVSVTGRKGHAEGHTNADGTCTFHTLAPGEYSVRASLPLDADTSVSTIVEEERVFLRARETVELTMELFTGDAVLWGEILGAADRVYLQLSIDSEWGSQKYSRYFGDNLTTEYSFSGLPAGEAVLKISWSNEGGNQSRRYELMTRPGQEIRHDVQLDGGTAIWGTVSPVFADERVFILVFFGRFSWEDWDNQNYS